MPIKIDAERAKIVKEMLWRGRRQEEIVGVTGASQATISRIKTGQSHQDIPWPDGSLGPMPAHGPSEEGTDWSVEAKRFLAFPEDMQKRILEVVNARRVEGNLPIIPQHSEEYLNYLQMEPEDAAFEALDLVKARASEDRRLVTIMLEFDRIVDEQAMQFRAQEILGSIESTRREPDLSQTGTNPDDLAYSRLEWQVVAERSPQNPIVLEASSSIAMMEACCVVFYSLRESLELWTSPRVHEEIRRLAKKFLEMPILMARLEKEYGVDE